MMLMTEMRAAPRKQRTMLFCLICASQRGERRGERGGCGKWEVGEIRTHAVIEDPWVGTRSMRRVDVVFMIALNKYPTESE